MKYGKTYSLRTQKAIARFGKSARHPICLAALDLWQLDAELLAPAKKAVVLSEKDIRSAKQQKEQAQVLYKQCCKEQKEKGAIEASVLLREIDKHQLLMKAQKRYQAAVKLLSALQGLRASAVARLATECDAASGDINTA